MQSRKFVGALTIAMAAMVPFSSAEDAKPAVSPKNGVIKLFNGTDLDGLYTFLSDTKYEDPRKVFTVHDGLLHISGDGLGGVTTKDAYRDYHLVLEYKWGKRTWGARKDRALDSGLLIHSVGKDGGSAGGIWIPSIEVQMIEGGTGDFILVAGVDSSGKPVPLSITCEIESRGKEVYWKKGGKRVTFDNKNRQRVNWYGRDPAWKDALGFRGKEDVEKPVGEWNTLEVTCAGDHILTVLNGKRVNEAFQAAPSAGKIQIQSELAELSIRRWELRPLAK